MVVEQMEVGFYSRLNNCLCNFARLLETCNLICKQADPKLWKLESFKESMGGVEGPIDLIQGETHW